MKDKSHCIKSIIKSTINKIFITTANTTQNS